MHIYGHIHTQTYSHMHTYIEKQDGQLHINKQTSSMTTGAVEFRNMADGQTITFARGAFGQSVASEARGPSEGEGGRATVDMGRSKTHQLFRSHPLAPRTHAVHEAVIVLDSFLPLL